MSRETAFVDAGKPAGMQAPVSFQGEAASAPAVAQVLRTAQRATLVRTDVVTATLAPAGVPVRTFKDDLRRKVALKKVMPPHDEHKAQKTAEPGAADSGQPMPRVPDPAQVMPVKKSDDERLDPGRPTRATKVDANYRYGGTPEKSCGACEHFIVPGACTVVSGLIREVDTCDWFEARVAPDVVVASLVQASEAKKKGKLSRWEPTIKRMKKHTNIRSPYALATWMQDQGFDPAKTSEAVESELVAVEAVLV